MEKSTISPGLTAAHGHSGPLGQGPWWLAHGGGLWQPMPPGSRPERGLSTLDTWSPRGAL
jgi:hypothetical protein